MTATAPAAYRTWNRWVVQILVYFTTVLVVFIRFGLLKPLRIQSNADNINTTKEKTLVKKNSLQLIRLQQIFKNGQTIFINTFAIKALISIDVLHFYLLNAVWCG